MQDVKPVAIAQKPCRFHYVVDTETNGIAAEFVDLEPALAAVDVCDITAVAPAHDFEIVDAVIELKADGHWKRGCQRSSAPPWRRVSVGHIQEQRRKGRFRSCILARRQQNVAIFSDKSRGRFA